MPQRKKPQARRPSEIFAERVRAVREARRWNQQDLADRLAEIGAATDRATVARTETGARGISLDDAITYTAALGSQFIHMVVGVTGGDVALAPGLEASDVTARRWLRGQLSLQEEHEALQGDERTYWSEIPEEEWLAQQRFGIGMLLRQVEGLVNAAVAEDREGMLLAIDSVNAELERQRADAERQKLLEQRPNVRKRG